MSCCEVQGNGESGGGGPITPEQLAEAFLYYEVDYAAQPSNAFADGTETIDGLDYTVANSALAGASWGLVNGSGIVVTNPAAARTWSLASPATAPLYFLPQSEIPNYDPQAPLICDVHLTDQLYTNGNDAMRFGRWQIAGSPYAASAAAARIADRGNFAGTSTIRSFDGTTVVTSPETFAPDVMSLRMEPFGAMQISFGTWAAGWPTVWGTALHFTTPNAALAPLSDLAARLAFIFINSALGMSTTIANMRLRRG